MKYLKKLFVLIVVLCSAFVVVSCGNSGSEAPVKIGVLVSDDTGSEALAFRNYYENYIQKEYNVKFMYSDKTDSAEKEAAAIDNFIANNCKAIISFSSTDRETQIQKCEDNKVYYAVATGTLTEEQYNKYKTYQYYVGAIGPDLSTEYQAGYNMAKYYLDNGKTKFAMFGGATPYFTEMHIYRAAGMLAAMCEVGEGDYHGATGFGIVGKIYDEFCQIAPTTMGSVELTAYVGGYDFNDAWFGSLAAAANSGAEVCLAVGSGETAFAGFVNGDVTYGDIDSYTSANAEYFTSGKLSYFEGKFSSSIGPIFIATLSAVQGKAIRTAEGYALALSQGYWEAKDIETFNKYLANSSSVTEPAYTKTILDQYVGANYEDFANFVAKFSFEEISNLNKK